MKQADAGIGRLAVFAGWLTGIFLLSAPAGGASEIIVRKAQGEVSVRRGVTEAWTPVKAGTAIGYESTLRTGLRSSAVLAIPGRQIQIPARVMVDVSDIRELSQEELMLKLTLRQVREAPYRGREGPALIPNAAVVHGTDGSSAPGLAEDDPVVGELLLNGTRMLFENGFYSTCALRTMEVITRFPALSTFETGWLAAESLERAGLRGEALRAFTELSARARNDGERVRLEGKIAALRGAR